MPAAPPRSDLPSGKRALHGAVGVIGDVHAEDAALAEALRRLEAIGATAVLCVGDLCDGPGDLDRCCALLAEREVVCVRGNHERWLLAGQMRSLPDAQLYGELAPSTQTFLRSLPVVERFDTPVGPLLLCHGLGDDDMAGVRPSDSEADLEMNFPLQALLGAGDVRLVVNGHTHGAMLRHVGARRVGELTIVNAGTLYRAHDPGFVVLRLDTAQVTFHCLGARDGETRHLGSLLREPT